MKSQEAQEQKKIVRRVVKIPRDERNPLYQFMSLMNDLVQPVENRLTPRELDILYMLYDFNKEEINKQSKDDLMDKLNFSSKTQIGAYIAVLFKKGVIFRSPTRAWVYHFNNFFFPSGNEIPSEIVIRISDGQT